MVAGKTLPEAFFSDDMDARHFQDRRDSWCNAPCLTREPLPSHFTKGGRELPAAEQGERFCQMLGNVLTDR